MRQFSFPAMLVNLDPAAVRRVDSQPQPIADDEARGYLGDVLARLGQSDEARANLGKVLEANPAAVRALTALGLLELRAGNMAAALPLLERAAQAGTGDAPAQAALGRALIARVAGQADDREAQMATLERARPILAVEIEPRAYTTAPLGYVELASGKDVARAATLLERAAREAPIREQYALMAAGAFLQLNQLDRARGYLGPLLAQGRHTEIRGAAREMLVRLAEIQTRASAAAATPAGGGAPPPGEPPGLAAPAPAGPAPRPSTALRPVNDGEVRVLGAFTAVECRAEGIVLAVDVGGKTMRLAAPQFGQIQFISYVPSAPCAIGCGPLPLPMRVLATYRAGGATGTDGEAVAIEAIPADYTPE